jgi:hypothetical protein
MIEYVAPIKDTLEALDLIRRWLRRERTAERTRPSERDRAIRAVLKATAETRAYLHDRQSGSRINRKREAKISQLWLEASHAVRHVHQRLSFIALVKSQCWAEPALWESPRFRNVPVKLDMIFDQCEWLLNNEA